MENREPVDPIAIYIQEAGSVETLTKEEEGRLFRELGGSNDWDEHRENIARRLIESKLMLVVNIARKHSAARLPMLDLLQEGNIGLMNAVKTFAKNPIGDFTTHAAACIERAIAKALGKSKER